MIQNLVTPNSSLASLLQARAFASSPRRLYADIGIGTVVALGGVWWHGRYWTLVAAVGVCLASYGVWAIAERRLDMETIPMSITQERLWGVVRGTAAMLGMITALIFGFNIAAATLGTWIS